MKDRLATACAAAGRRASDVTLIAVTKGFPAEDIRMLSELGVADFGENRADEGGAKRSSLADIRATWHCVGQVQTNKARKVAAWADVVHSVDRPALAHALERAAADLGRTLTVFLQVDLREPSIDPARAELPGAGGRAGVGPGDVPALAEIVAECAHIACAGVMAVAPLDREPAAAFDELARASERVRAVIPAARSISAGMSGDLEAAISAGATHVRIGGAILGKRPRGG